MGRRQHEQAQRSERVTASAWRLFTHDGFEATTVRRIAAEAGVSVGTVLNSGDKGTLLVTLFNDALRERVDIAPEFDVPLDERIWHRFGVFFDFYAEVPELTRAYLRELLGERRVRHDGGEITATFITQLTATLRAHAPSTSSHDETELLAQTLFAVYLATLIGWLSGTHSLDTALAGCRGNVTHHVTQFLERHGASPAVRA